MSDVESSIDDVYIGSGDSNDDLFDYDASSDDLEAEDEILESSEDDVSIREAPSCRTIPIRRGRK